MDELMNSSCAATSSKDDGIAFTCIHSISDYVPKKKKIIKITILQVSYCMCGSAVMCEGTASWAGADPGFCFWGWFALGNTESARV